MDEGSGAAPRGRDWERSPPFGAPTPETVRFVERLTQTFEAAPPPWTTPVHLIRRLRAAGKGVLPIEGPSPELDWVCWADAPFAAADGPNRGRWTSPAAPKGLYLHFHGGGWTFGAPEQFDGRLLRLSRAADVAVISAQYRLGPERRWPEPLEDAVAALRWAEQKAQSLGAPLFVGGESAGAHLAAVALTAARRAGQPAEVAGAALTYGCFDLAMTPSMRRWGARMLVLSTPVVEWFIQNLLGVGSAAPLARDPAVSPLWDDLSGMPPALFQVGDADPLLDDSLFMAARWRAAGAEAALAVWPGAPHAFDQFTRLEDALPIALESQALTAAFLRERLGS